AYAGFTEADAAIAYARQFTDSGKTVVLKADGLAAGKGVVLTADTAEMQAVIRDMMQEGSLGEAGRRLIIEECLEGEELSYFAICDGKHYLPLMTAQDHKRVFDHDQGPNTGGMGAYSSPPVFTPELGRRIVKEIIEPTIAGMAAEGCPYTGVLYAGLMLTADGPKVLEYNARFGDPETQVMMPMIAGDLYPVLQAAAAGNLTGQSLEVRAGNCVGVVLASGGYPGAFNKGRPISGLDELKPDTLVFHAGTARRGDQLVTNGGRVMLIARCDSDIAAAQAAVYEEIKKISFADMHYRTDIAQRALK
ncbi:MAG: phosphoribosylamine--glycine ligase, partial [Syntrophomonadaceae bacterium]|nr:phosphoribosylamine--glycine ligase [Syntrophomonadaceae bacterium]